MSVTQPRTSTRLAEKAVAKFGKKVERDLLIQPLSRSELEEIDFKAFEIKLFTQMLAYEKDDDKRYSFFASEVFRIIHECPLLLATYPFLRKTLRERVDKLLKEAPKHITDETYERLYEAKKELAAECKRLRREDPRFRETGDISPYFRAYWSPVTQEIMYENLLTGHTQTSRPVV